MTSEQTYPWPLLRADIAALRRDHDFHRHCVVCQAVLEQHTFCDTHVCLNLLCPYCGAKYHLDHNRRAILTSWHEHAEEKTQPQTTAAPAPDGALRADNEDASES